MKPEPRHPFIEYVRDHTFIGKTEFRPRTTYFCTDLSDLLDHSDELAPNDLAVLPRARWWSTQERYVLTLRGDSSRELQVGLVRNPFHEQDSFFPSGFVYPVDVPRHLLVKLYQHSRSGSQIYNVVLINWPNQGLKILDLDLEPIARQKRPLGYGLQFLDEHPEIDGSPRVK